MPHPQDRKRPLLLMHLYPQIIHPTAERFSPSANSCPTRAADVRQVHSKQTLLVGTLTRETVQLNRYRPDRRHQGTACGIGYSGSVQVAFAV